MNDNEPTSSADQGRSHITLSSHQQRPEWREYHLRRFQNKMESIHLQDQQSELKMKAIKMEREQKLKNLKERMDAQDESIRLMRLRHANESENLKKLWVNTNRRASSVLQTDSMIDDDNSPLGRLRQFSRAMDERYNILTKGSSSRYRQSQLRAASIDPRSYESGTSGPSYASVKSMLNYLPVTPIFKETTVALSTKRAGLPTDLLARRQRDVQVPLKDYEDQPRPLSELRTALKKNGATSERIPRSVSMNKTVSFNEDTKPARHKTLSQRKYANLVNLYSFDKEGKNDGNPSVFGTDRYALDATNRPRKIMEEE